MKIIWHSYHPTYITCFVDKLTEDVDVMLTTLYKFNEIPLTVTSQTNLYTLLNEITQTGCHADNPVQVQWDTFDSNYPN